MNNITVKDLESAYSHVKPFIELVKDLRESPEIVTRERLNGLFEKSTWEKIKQKGGHANFKDPITGIHVGWQNHVGRELPKKQRDRIRDEVQKYLNILGNEIFSYRVRNWKENPDFKASLSRYDKRYKSTRS